MHKINILIVDDKQANIYALQTLLQSNQEIHIYEALSVTDALALIMKERIDLILSDIQMPQINGFEFAKILKQNAKTKNIPFIFMTAAYNNEVYQKEGYSLGAIEYITKPIDEMILRLKLSKYIEIFQAHRKIEQQQKYINKILEVSAEGHIIIDSSMLIFDFNEKAKHIFPKLTTGTAIDSLLEEEELYSLIEIVTSQNEKVFTCKYKNKYYKAHYKKFDETLFILSFFEITDEIKKNKRQDVIYNSQKAIVVLTDGKNIKNINSIFFEEFGFKNLQHFREHHKCICELFVAKEGENYLAPLMNGVIWNKYIHQNKTQLHEVLMMNKEGKEKIYELRASGNLFMEEDEEDEEEVIVFNDITDLKEKNQMLLLQSRQAAMGEMVSMIAHQWRQPLSTITLILSSMKIKYELNGFNLDDFKENVSKAHYVVKHLSTTIDEFRDYFKQKEGNKIFIEKMFEGLETIIKPILKENSIRLLYEKSDTWIEGQYEVDGRLDQVLLNIYQNAIDALKGKESLSEKVITIRFHKDEKSRKAHIFICDNGGGIPLDIIDKIFTPYFSTKSKNGTGLGLYMSKNIVEKHMDGFLNVYNIEDGACFEIQLPLSKIEKK